MTTKTQMAGAHNLTFSRDTLANCAAGDRLFQIPRPRVGGMQFVSTHGRHGFYMSVSRRGGLTRANGTTASRSRPALSQVLETYAQQSSNSNSSSSQETLSGSSSIERYRHRGGSTNTISPQSTVGDEEYEWVAPDYDTDETDERSSSANYKNNKKLPAK